MSDLVPGLKLPDPLAVTAGISYENTEDIVAAVAGAQLARAAWGLVADAEKQSFYYPTASLRSWVRRVMRDLEAAGIPRPKDSGEEDG